MEYLNEGIRFFKESKKLKKLVSQMEFNLLNNISNEDQRKELREYINTVKTAIKEFEMVENEFEHGDKKKAKLLFRELKKKYAYLLARVEKPLLNLFKQYGSSLLYFATIQIFTRMFMPKITTIIDAKKEVPTGTPQA